MAGVEEYAKQPREQRLARIERTAAELAEAVRGRSAEALEIGRAHV